MVAFWNEQILFLGFLNDDKDLKKEIRKLGLKYPEASFDRNDVQISSIGNAVFKRGKFNLFVRGTDFQIKVWEELKSLKRGETITYGELASRIGNPLAVRAVATAVGKNDISVLVPCHRIVRKDGSIGQYRWGKSIKKKLINDRV